MHVIEQGIICYIVVSMVCVYEQSMNLISLSDMALCAWLSRVLSLGGKLYKVLSRRGGGWGMPRDLRSSEIDFYAIREVKHA